MKYRFMAVDIDGTLLDSSGRLTEANKEAIRMAVWEGLIFTLSTGRPVQGVQSLINALQLDTPVITYNGAMVVMGKSREILYEQKLSAKDAKNVIELGNQWGCMVAVWVENKLYVNELSEEAIRYSTIAGIAPEKIVDMETLVRDGVTKVLWNDDPAVVGKYQEEIGSYLSGNVNYHTSRPMFLEFVDKKASKALAMEKIGEHFGIRREEMIAVGDGFNDLSMIEYAGLGVAMANAKEAIRQKADYVTLSNDDDGVAHVIRKFVL
ncbi:MAG: HAD family phosphatase, partial [Ruminiclostridium sp.]|nr:HAD family phosphatase [Ruminiclostridium sp.]